MTAVARPLESGWLADTPVEDSVLRRFLVNQSDMQDRFVTAVGGRSDRTADVALTDSGTPAPFLKQAVLQRPVVDADDAVLDDIAKFYAGSIGVVLSAWPTPDLTNRGWHLVGHPMFVVRGPRGLYDAEAPVDVTVRLSESAADLAVVERIVVEG